MLLLLYLEAPTFLRQHFPSVWRTSFSLYFTAGLLTGKYWRLSFIWEYLCFTFLPEEHFHWRQNSRLTVVISALSSRLHGFLRDIYCHSIHCSVCTISGSRLFVKVCFSPVWWCLWAWFSLSLSCLGFSEFLQSIHLCVTKFGKISALLSSNTFSTAIFLLLWDSNDTNSDFLVLTNRCCEALFFCFLTSFLYIFQVG